MRTLHTDFEAMDVSLVLSGHDHIYNRTQMYGGLISGKPGNPLDPYGTATRAEVATILARFASQNA